MWELFHFNQIIHAFSVEWDERTDETISLSLLYRLVGKITRSENFFSGLFAFFLRSYNHEDFQWSVTVCGCGQKRSEWRKVGDEIVDEFESFGHYGTENEFWDGKKLMIHEISTHSSRCFRFDDSQFLFIRENRRTQHISNNKYALLYICM